MGYFHFETTSNRGSRSQLAQRFNETERFRPLDLRSPRQASTFQTHRCLQPGGAIIPSVPLLSLEFGPTLKFAMYPPQSTDCSKGLSDGCGWRVGLSGRIMSRQEGRGQDSIVYCSHKRASVSTQMASSNSISCMVRLSDVMVGPPMHLPQALR